MARGAHAFGYRIQTPGQGDRPLRRRRPAVDGRRAVSGLRSAPARRRKHSGPRRRATTSVAFTTTPEALAEIARTAHPKLLVLYHQRPSTPAVERAYAKLRELYAGPFVGRPRSRHLPLTQETCQCRRTYEMLHPTSLQHSDIACARLALIALALTLPRRSQPNRRSTRDPATTASWLAFENFADIFGSRLKAASFDSIPAGRYDYRPTPPQQTVGYIAQHLEDANYTLCERIADLKHPRTAKDSLADTVKARWPKGHPRRAPRETRSASATRPWHAWQSSESAPKARVLLAFADRSGGTLQPDRRLHATARHGAALCAAAQAAYGRSKLPTSALSPYVGVYELAPEMQLDVTMRGRRALREVHGGRHRTPLGRKQSGLLPQGGRRPGHLHSGRERRRDGTRGAPVRPRQGGEEDPIAPGLRLVIRRKRA